MFDVNNYLHLTNDLFTTETKPLNAPNTERLDMTWTEWHRSKLITIDQKLSDFERVF